jgi:hypothetical protein
MVQKLLPDFQSAYWAYLSTETAILKVLTDILRVVDRSNLTFLASIFDSVNHAIYLRHLDASYGLHPQIVCLIAWQRAQFVRCGKSCSNPASVLYEVPQGSVLGSILFLFDMADRIRIVVDSHGLLSHLYADDTQIYGFCLPASKRCFRAT